MRIVLVTSRFPLPAWRGNQVRTCEWLDALNDHDVCVVCPEPENRDLGVLSTQCRTYSLSAAVRLFGLSRAIFSGLPFLDGLYHVGAGRRAFRAALDERPCDLVVVQMLRCGWAAEVLEEAAPGVPWIFDAIDSMGLHFSQSVNNYAALWRPLVRAEARRCQRRERDLGERASLVTAVTRRDLDAITFDAINSDAINIGRSFVVPVAGKNFLGSLTRDSQPTKDNQSTKEKQPTILLSGNLGYRPTVAAAAFFAAEVWPLISETFPNLRWVLAGARPDSQILRLNDAPRIEVHGDVDDLMPFLERATIAIAPMATGSGVPMKVLEAWAAGVPVVAHPLAVAGLEAGHRSGVAVAETPEQWVRKIVELLSDSKANENLVERGQAIWSETYSPERIRQSIHDAVSRALCT